MGRPTNIGLVFFGFYLLQEALLVLWLSVKGVDEKRWHELATARLRGYGQPA